MVKTEETVRLKRRNSLIWKQYQEGKTKKEISEEYSLSIKYVNNIIRMQETEIDLERKGIIKR